MALTYSDPYLSPHASAEREARALEDVRSAGDFPTEWEERLQVLRVYILICLESTVDDEDTFSVKLKQYKAEYQAQLIKARAAEAAAAGSVPIFASVNLLRG